MKKILSLLSLFLIFSQTSHGMFAQRALMATKTMIRRASQTANSNKNQPVSLKEARQILRERFDELANLKYKQRSSGFNPDENFEHDIYFIQKDFSNILAHLGKQKKTQSKKN